MEKEWMFNCIENPESMDTATVDKLRNMVDAYPYFQTARLLYTQNLHLIRDERYGYELGKTAIFCADRSRLFYLIHAERYEWLTNLSDVDTMSEKDRTEALLDSYLQSFEEKEKHSATSVEGVDHAASIDYFSYLESQGEELRGEGDFRNKLQHQDIIDAFIEKADNDRIRSSMTTGLTESKKESKEETGSEFLTETLAKIYMKQKKYEQALTIIKRLSLNFPKKSTYFADQIRFLEYLIINEKNKK